MNRPTLRVKATAAVLGVAIALSSLALFGGAAAPEAAPAASAAQADYYLKLDGVEGESTADKHKGEIEINSWSWGMNNAGSGGMGGGAGAGKMLATGLVITKRIDKGTPALFLACAQGEHIKRAVLTATRPNKELRGPEDYVRITLEDVTCTSFSQQGSQSEWSTESVSLSFQKITIETLAKGGSEWQRAGWDLAKNVKI